MVKRLLWEQEIGGSNPLTPTTTTSAGSLCLSPGGSPSFCLIPVAAESRESVAPACANHAKNNLYMASNPVPLKLVK